MKKISFILIILVLNSCVSSKQVTKTVNATKDKTGNLVGFANKAMFLETPFANWFNPNYNRYNPDKEIITNIKKDIKKYQIKGFIGTWCGDSKRELPKFYKILDLTDFNKNKFELVTLNRSKKTPDNLQKGYNIIRVPTFIFYENGKEIGRFVERPIQNLEKDILKIVSKQEYKHAYQR